MASDLQPTSVRRSMIARALRAVNGRPHLMGIINVTPDSFHEASRVDTQQAIHAAITMWDQGATWVDIGGESTRPGADPISLETELSRVIPVIQGLRDMNQNGLISIDTRHAEVAIAAIQAGADLVNDVSGLRDLNLKAFIIEHQIPVCVMHMLGEPNTMQSNPTYLDCQAEVKHFLISLRAELISQGMSEEIICIDPGIGFGKTQHHNIELLQMTKSDWGEDIPVLWGVSRKSIVGHLTGQPQSQHRLFGTLGLAAAAVHQGIDLLRVHDVQAHRELLDALMPIVGSNATE